MYRDALQHTNLIEWPPEADDELQDEAGESIDNLLAYIPRDDTIRGNNLDEERGEQDILQTVALDIQEIMGDQTSRSN